MCEANKYEDNTNCTFDELSSLVEDFIKEMGTYDYWLEYGSDFPEENKGFDLFQQFCLISKFWRVHFDNCEKPDVINDSSSDSVPIIFGHSVYNVSLKNVRAVSQLQSRLKRMIKQKGNTCSRKIWLQYENGYIQPKGRVHITDSTIMFGGNCD